MRTYGTLTLTQPGGWWQLDVEPHLAIRAKRILGRARNTRGGYVGVRDTAEVARDIEWLISRWPVEVEDDTLAYLTERADTHRAMEARVGELLATPATLFDLPREPARAPRDYQRFAVEMLRARGALLLTDELGLGKTYTALLSLVHADALPAVVVPPTHLPRRWMTEIQESFPFLTAAVAQKTTAPASWEREESRPDVLIVPYSRLSGWRHHLRGWAKTVIFDEVQELRKGIETLKGSAASDIADAATYRLGLTATPVYNYAGEVWQIIQILAKGELGTADEFSREWGGGGWQGSGHFRVKDPAALGSYLREQGLMVGRTRKEVGRELPKTIKTVQVVDSDPTVLEKVAGDAAAMARLILADTTDRKDRFQAAGELDWKLREATGIAKAAYVAEFCRLLLQSEQKIILFGWHRAVYDIWNEALAEFNPAMYTGSETPKQKAAAEEAFTTGNARVLIMSLRSGSGVDGLQKVTSTVVFGELDWSPQVHEQGIGRARRDGMDDAPVNAYFLVAESGSDPVILQVLDVKRNQGEPIVSPDGRLFNNAIQDVNRGRALAELVLGISKEAKS